MKLVWTKGTSLLSRAILWGLNEPVSHFGVVFDNKVVFHSNLLGTHLNWVDTFIKHSTIIYWIEYNLTLEQEEAVYQKMIKYDERPYDFPSFFYFAYCILMKKFFKRPIPITNAYNQPTEFLCYEIAEGLNGIAFNQQVEGLLISPYQLYCWLLKDLNK